MSRILNFYAIKLDCPMTKNIKESLKIVANVRVVFGNMCWVVVEIAEEASPFLNLEDNERDDLYLWLDNNINALEEDDDEKIFCYSWSFH